MNTSSAVLSSISPSHVFISVHKAVAGTYHRQSPPLLCLSDETEVAEFTKRSYGRMDVSGSGGRPHISLHNIHRHTEPYERTSPSLLGFKDAKQHVLAALRGGKRRVMREVNAGCLLQLYRDSESRQRRSVWLNNRSETASADPSENTSFSINGLNRASHASQQAVIILRTHLGPDYNGLLSRHQTP
ncbi:hypothetical protein FQA47_024352 [Oryzias melastigma]|uniref:Uncharacterized protein n=1 Tax=Oryzias melastigma TaxID=30732 RepID=A0A834F8P2_ORYME|nr:hypothetical protein FQA47_024352 [Oryzias melastigma]